jgi:hypothetical protein
MKKDCVVDFAVQKTIENGQEMAYLTLRFSPRKCALCNWQDGWKTKYWLGQHPCRVMMVGHPNFYSAYDNNSLFGKHTWDITFRFNMAELVEFEQTMKGKEDGHSSDSQARQQYNLRLPEGR